MKYYLIYNKHGHFIGITDDKKIVKRLKEIRDKRVFNTTKISKKKLSKNVNITKTLSEFGIDFLKTTYSGTDSEIPIFNYEYYWLEESLIKIFNRHRKCVSRLIETIDFIKFSHNDLKIITDVLLYMEEYLHELSSYMKSGFDFDDVFDLENVFKYSEMFNYNETPPF